MPDGELETDPEPVPVLLTDRVKFEVGGGGEPPSNLAVTLLAVLIVTTQVPRLRRSQGEIPANVEPGSAAPVSWT
jgi:hypothetical protein